MKKKKRKFNPFLSLFILGVLSIAGILTFQYLKRNNIFFVDSVLTEVDKNTNKKNKSKFKKNDLESNIVEILKKYETREKSIKMRLFPEERLREIEAYIPKGNPIEIIVQDFFLCAKGTRFKVIDCVLNSKKKQCTIQFASNKRKKQKTILILREGKSYYSKTGYIAFVLYDFNFEPSTVSNSIITFSKPLTFAVPVSTSKLSWRSEMVKEYKKELILQFPLEPKIRQKKKYKNWMIMVHYPDSKIKEIIRKATNKINFYSGYSNILGSQACEDSRIMQVMLDEAKTSDVYFLEEVTAKRSVAKSIAESISLPYGTIQSTIEETRSKEHISGKIKHLSLLAQQTKHIIIKVKTSKPFIQTLKELDPFFEQNGIQLAYVSDIVRKRIWK